MAFAPLIVMGIATVLTVAGQMQAAKAAKKQAAAIKQADDFEAAQMRQQAGQAQASAQRLAMTEQRRTQLVASRTVAVAASSGGSAADPTVMNLLADIEGEGAYRRGVAIYQGEERARQFRMGAEGKEFEGEVALQGGSDRARAYQTSAFGSALSNSASLYGRYGMGGPKSGGLVTSGGGGSYSGQSNYPQSDGWGW